MSDSRKYDKRGFTLVEILLAVSLTGMLLAAATGSLIFLAKSTRGIGNYQEMNMESRFALEDFGSDARMTTEVNAATTTVVSLDVYDAAGSVSRAIYTYNANDGTLERTFGGVTGDPMAVATGATTTLLEDLVSLNFIYYDLHGDPTTNPLEIKEVQIQAEMERNVLSITNTNEIISARFMMRNRKVST